MGENPRNIDYNQSVMRIHLECFKKEGTISISTILSACEEV